MLSAAPEPDSLLIPALGRTQNGMTKNVNSRTRVQAGVKTGGQFAAEIHREPQGVALAPAPSPLDKAAVAAAADMVRTRAAYETGRWQRRQDKGGLSDLHTPPLPPELVELNRQAEAFESLPREEQAEVMDKLNFAGAKHLLEPGQKLGTDKIQVAEGLDPEGGKIGLALVAQKRIADAGLPGAVTMTEAGAWTAFTVQDGNIKHGLTVGATLVSFSAEGDDDSDYTRDSWLSWADRGVYGGTVFEQDRAEDIRRYYDDHHECAVMMDVMAGSPFRDHGEHFGQLDRGGRTAVLKADGAQNVLDVSGDEAVLTTDDGIVLHPSMANGFLDHVAARTGHPDREAFAADLREVFRETERRLIR